MKFDSLPSRLARRLQQFLQVREIRNAVALVRYFVLRVVLRRSKTISDPDRPHLGRETFNYNFATMRRSVTTVDRMHHLLRPVTAIASVATNLPTLKTLSIGPRAEGELLLIAGYGFSWNNIHAVDLFSYSPRIDVSDMHDMPYGDSTFDIVFSGWCLAYSDDPPRALREMIRVLKDGGIVAFGQGHSQTGELTVGGRYKSNSLDEIFAPIQDHIDTVYFRHEITPEMREKDLTAIVHVFSIKKAEAQPATALAG